jgi:23S rRNA pseudouridine955/2504/2580 synthase
MLDNLLSCGFLLGFKVLFVSGVRIIEVEEDRSGQRLDNFLMYYLNNVPKSRIYRIIRKGEVRINKGRAKPDTKLAAGDLVRVPPVTDAAKKPDDVQPSQGLRATLDKAIVFEDDVMMAVNKPSGLAVHGGSGLKMGLIEALRADKTDIKFLELVHRLDRDTSGIVLVAKKRKALTLMQDEFRLKKNVQKTYWCLVKGQWPKNVNKIDAPLLRHEESKSGERRVSVHPDGKPSVTKYRLLKQFEHCAWVEAQPVTGRTHQIRVHCVAAGCPILGDDKYQDEEAAQIAKSIGLKRLFLHAAQLTIPHPIDRKEMAFVADLEPKLKALLASLSN